MAILSVEGKCAISSDPAWHWVSVIPAGPCLHPVCGEGKLRGNQKGRAWQDPSEMIHD